MFTDQQGPIEKFEWGRFTVSGKLHTDTGQGVGKDIRIIGTEVTEWAERHGHNLKPEMVTGVHNLGIEILIIGNGVNQALACSDTVRRSVAEKGIPRLIVLATPEACRMYNRLHRQGHKVALLAHGTC